MLTLFPFALSAIISANLAALFSMLPEAGTDAVMTSTPFEDNASLIPRQY